MASMALSERLAVPRCSFCGTQRVLTIWTAEEAVVSGCIPCLDFARRKGCDSWHFAAPEMACKLGRLECLQHLVRNGAKTGYFTVRAAAHEGQWECLDWALRNGCPVACNDDLARPHFVRVWVGDLFDKAVARAEREAAACVVQAAWFRAYYDPVHPVCRRRVARQFQELSAAF